MSWFKPHLERLTAYPYKKVEAAIKLDQNESPWDLPDELKEAALRRLRALSWNRYPDMHAESLRAAAILIKPFLPRSAETIYKNFNFVQPWDGVRCEDVWVYPRQNDDLRVLAQLDTAGQVKPLFPRIT